MRFVLREDFRAGSVPLQVAGLPPVTKEWFEARRAQLAGASTVEVDNKLWIDPLTRKKFMSENTYLAHTRSKKYLDIVKKSGAPMPAPIIITKAEEGAHANDNGAYRYKVLSRLINSMSSSAFLSDHAKSTNFTSAYKSAKGLVVSTVTNSESDGNNYYLVL